MSDSDQRPVIIKPTMDASGVRPGAEEVKKTARDMAQAVGAAGRQAGEGLASVGEGAKKGAAQAEREIGRIEASLRRATAAAQAGGRGTAAFYEADIKLRGLDVERFRPYIDGLKAAEAAQKAASGSLNTMGMSAAQTTAALRQVPMQFTDIVTSLASGQRPLQVFLQQGGQLKDVFGGAGAAARALGGYVATLISPFTLAAAAVAAIGAGFVLGARESEEYRRALILTGNAAGVTADQLAAMARAISTGSPITQSKAAEVLTLVARSGDVAADSLQRYTKAAIELERAGGPAAEETAKAFSDLARDPLSASLRLTESVRYLSRATSDQIRELERQGKATEAAKVAQEAYAQAIEQRTPDLAKNLGLVERAWLAIKDAAKSAGSAALEVGRQDTLADQVANLDGRIATLRRIQAARPNTSAKYGADEQRLTAERDLLQEQIRLSERAAQAQAQQARQLQANNEYEKLIAGHRKESARYADDIAKFVNTAVAAGRSQAEIEEGILNIRRKYSELTTGVQLQESINAAAVAEEQIRQQLQQTQALRERGAISQREAIERTTELELQGIEIQRRAAAAKLALATEEGRTGKDLLALRGQLAVIDQQYVTRAQAGAYQIAAAYRQVQDAIKDVAIAQAEEARSDLAKDINDRYEATKRAYTAYNDFARSVEESNDLARIEVQYMGHSNAARRIAIEQYQITLELKRQLRDLDASLDLDAGQRASLRADYERLAAERSAAAAGRIYTEEWARTADQVGQSLADAIFEGGKSAGKLLQDYFKTLVLQPIVQTLLRPLGTVFATALGGQQATAATAASGGGGVGGIGNLISLAGAGLGSFGTTLGAGAAATIGGTSLTSLLSASGAAIGNGAFAAGAGLAIGSAVPYIAAAAAAYYLGKKAFGRELQDTGVQGSFGAEGDFSGQDFKFYKGGWLRSDKTKTSPLSSAMEAVLDAGGLAANLQAKAYANALGLPVQAMEGFVSKIKISLKGLSQEQAQAAIEKAVAGYQEGLLGRYSAQLEPLRKMGETLSQTAERLVSLQNVSGALYSLGGAFTQLATSSVAAREELVQMAGGMDALSQQAQSYAQNYYSRDEIAGLKAREVSAALQATGIDAGGLRSRSDFRSLVDGTDVSTTAGRQQLAALLAVGDEFAQIADYLAEAGGTLASTAALAPQSGTLAELFAQPAQAQVEATDRVAGWTEAVYHAVNKLTSVMSGQGSRMSAPASPPEVNGGTYNPGRINAANVTNSPWGPDGAYYGV